MNKFYPHDSNNYPIVLGIFWRQKRNEDDRPVMSTAAILCSIVEKYIPHRRDFTG
jgi:hypothetical protein